MILCVAKLQSISHKTAKWIKHNHKKCIHALCMRTILKMALCIQAHVTCANVSIHTYVDMQKRIHNY